MTSSRPAVPPSIFDDLDTYVAMPRIAGLTLSPDGTRLVTGVATPNPEGTGYRTALWEVDPGGSRPARRLTRSRQGESGAAFAADGTLWFTSARPGAEEEESGAPAALWALPADGGEARVVYTRPGGVTGIHPARDTDRLVLGTPVLVGARDEDEDAALRRGRKEAGVDALLHTGYPVRYWDHDLGPSTDHLGVLEADPEHVATPDPLTTADAVTPRRLRDVTPGVGAAIDRQTPSVSPDGRFALISWTVLEARGERRQALARVDLTDGTREILLDLPGQDVSAGPISPDGTRAVIDVARASTTELAPDHTLHLLDLGTGEATPLTPDWDVWAGPAAWTADGSAVLALADLDGRAPVFRVGVDGDERGRVRQVTTDDAAYSTVVTGPDAGTAYAIRSSYALAPEVVRIDLADGTVTALPAPVEQPALPGRLEEVETTHADGTRVRSWLALPHEDVDGGHPLLLWIHGGPLSSWNAWTWRWNPWLMVAQGYAVLLPDPALSTGYGQDFIQRGWGSWGAAPYEDLMAATDAVVARPDIDAGRTAAMGGSFGGYMANWVAGHTDRFRAVVTHASLWALDQFGPTTDMAAYWQREMSPEMMAEHSPHRFVEDIVSPMLVIHGDKDYRVPIGEGLRLWFELLSRSQGALDEQGRTAHRFLYFPQENHWILAPQHAKVWYQVVSAFLAEHVLGETRELPTTLGLTAPDPQDVAALRADRDA